MLTTVMAGMMMKMTSNGDVCDDDDGGGDNADGVPGVPLVLHCRNTLGWGWVVVRIVMTSMVMMTTVIPLMDVDDFGGGDVGDGDGC